MSRIIDAHGHIFPEKIAHKAADSIGKFYDIPMYTDAAPSTLLRNASEAGIAMTLVCSSAVTPGQTESINSFIASECASHPEFFGLAALHPDFKGYEEEIARAISLGLHGFKFHSDFQKFYLDDDSAIPMFRAIAKTGLPVLLHAGDERYEYSSPKTIANLMRKVPDLRVIAAHFGGYSRWDEVGELPVCDRLCFDTSSSLFKLSRNDALRLIDHFGTDKFFFGTDFPMWSPIEELGRFRALGLDEETERMILSENFERFFGIK